MFYDFHQVQLRSDQQIRSLQIISETPFYEFIHKYLFCFIFTNTKHAISSIFLMACSMFVNLQDMKIRNIEYLREDMYKFMISKVHIYLLSVSRTSFYFLVVPCQFLSAIQDPVQQIKHIIQMKLIAILCVLALIHIATSGECVNCQPNFIRPRSEIGNQIDQTIRATYWYYLPRAFLTYVAHIDSEGGCIYLHLYKNYIGTFLAITNYNFVKNKAVINTFVRVGDGCTTEEEINAPIQPQVFVISLNLGDGQYFVDHQTQERSFNWDTQWARNRWFSHRQQLEQERVHQNCLKVQKYIKTNYWYYLTPDTKTLDFSESNPGRGCYCSFTYINYIGLFQVIGQWDYFTNSPVVNTFVRLGDGSNPNQVQKCRLFPSIS